MTFLEYILTRCLGQPRFRNACDVSKWSCPSCGSNSAFGTMPHRPPLKDRVQCFACGFRGDAPDVLLLLNPTEGWPARRARLAH
jgi:hypothetical protein